MVIGFEEERYEGSEDGGTVEVAVVLLSGTLATDVQVTVESADDTATGQ